MDTDEDGIRIAKPAELRLGLNDAVEGGNMLGWGSL
jgi:hypothetical protein